MEQYGTCFSLIFTVDDSLGQDRLLDKTGQCLGRLENEIEDGYEITHFCSTAPKAYALRIASLTDPSDTKVVIKQKGISLTSSAKEKITFESMKDLVDKYIQDEEAYITTEQFMMKKSLRGGITSTIINKDTRVVMNKLRVLENSYSTLPFGYREACDIVMDI